MANYATSSLKLSDTYVNTLPYNTCSTAAGTAAKTVSAGTFSLETGAMVVVKFTVTNTAANPTLNVSSTGAKAIYYNGAAITAGYLKANKIYQFIYNGTQWDLVGDVDTNTNTNYYHTPSYTGTAPSSPTGGSSNIKIGTGTGVNDLYVPVATASTPGATIVYPAQSCTTFSSDSGTVTPAAVQKGAKQFAITRPSSSTANAVARYSNTTGDVKDSKIRIEDVTNTKDTSKTANVLVIPAEGDKKMVYGYCTDQTDGTSFIGGVFDNSATSYPYSAGLAIGGTSGNLLWKGVKVATVSDIPSVPSATTTTPKINGTAAVGSESKWAKGDHVHPTDTSRAPTSHASSATTYGVSSASNYGHAKASGTTPKANGTAAVGSETSSFARGDHVHPAQTSVSGNAGSANKVNQALTVKLNSGTTEGTDMFTFDGSTTKSVNITPSAVGAAASSHNHAASNITSGTLSSSRLPTVPITKGGTGATTAAGALTNLGITATATELNYMDGVTSNVQTQLNTIKASSGAKVGDTLTTMRTDLDDTWLLCNGAAVNVSDYKELSETCMKFPATTEFISSDLITSLGSSGTIRGIAYANGCWAAVCVVYDNDSIATAKLLYTTDITGTWSTKDLWSGKYNNNAVTGISYINGYWVITGYDYNYPSSSSCTFRIAYTADPASEWTIKDLITTSSRDQHTVVYADGYWAIGVDTYDSAANPKYRIKLLYTTDITGTWSTKDLWSSNYDSRLTGLAYANNCWAAVGYIGQSTTNKYAIVAHSVTLADTWTEITFSPSIYSGRLSSYGKLIYANGYWVVVGDAGDDVTCHYTTDITSETWSKVTIGSGSSYSSFVYEHGLFVVATHYWNTTQNVNTIYYGRSPASFTSIDLNKTSSSAGSGITFSDGRWVIVMNSSNYQYGLTLRYQNTLTLPAISSSPCYTYIKAKED